MLNNNNKENNIYHANDITNDKDNNNKDNFNINVLLNADGNTPLHTAVIGGNEKIVKFLVEHWNADGSIKNNDGDTPLELARKLGDTNVANYLSQNII